MTDLIAELAEVVTMMNELHTSKHIADLHTANRRAGLFIRTRHAKLTRRLTDDAEVRKAYHELVIRLGEVTTRLEAADVDALKWQLLCADCDDAGEGNRAAINVVNDACRLGSGALERHYGQAARDGAEADHAERDAMMGGVMVSLGPELLRFYSFQDWVNHAQSRFANARVASSDYICIDATGRICRIGMQFMSARDRGAFPVVVYHIDPERTAAMRDSAGEE